MKEKLQIYLLFCVLHLFNQIVDHHESWFQMIERERERIAGAAIFANGKELRFYFQASNFNLWRA